MRYKRDLKIPTEGFWTDLCALATRESTTPDEVALKLLKRALAAIPSARERVTSYAHVELPWAIRHRFGQWNSWSEEPPRSSNELVIAALESLIQREDMLQARTRREQDMEYPKFAGLALHHAAAGGWCVATIEGAVLFCGTLGSCIEAMRELVVDGVPQEAAAE